MRFANKVICQPSSEEAQQRFPYWSTSKMDSMPPQILQIRVFCAGVAFVALPIEPKPQTLLDFGRKLFLLLL